MAVQTVLQSDKDMGAVLGSNQNFERWIKHGFSADDLVNTSNDSEEHPSGGSHSVCHCIDLGHHSSSCYAVLCVAYTSGMNMSLHGRHCSFGSCKLETRHG